MKYIGVKPHSFEPKRDMKKTAAIFPLYLCLLFLLASISPGWLMAETGDIQFQGDKMSADLKGVSLGSALAMIEQEKGIWFKGDASSLKEKVNVTFGDSSLQDGLKRILWGLNYSLVFDGQKRLKGVFILGKSTHGSTKGGNRPSPMPAQTVVSKMKEGYKHPADGLDDWKSEASPGDNIKVTENDLANLKVIENAPTPGGPVEVTQEELEAFRVEATKEELEAFKVVESGSSPGDPATFSAEELESVKPADKTPSPQETGVPR